MTTRNRQTTETYTAAYLPEDLRSFLEAERERTGETLSSLLCEGVRLLRKESLGTQEAIRRQRDSIEYLQHLIVEQQQTIVKLKQR